MSAATLTPQRSFIMAMKDVKTIQVEPEEEESTVRLFQSFGWELKNNQEVKTSDSSHLERRGDTIYNVTKSGVHYIKLTFERDPARRNYAKLKSLEEQYYSVENPGYPEKPVLFGLLWGIIIVVGLLFFPISIAVIIWRSVRYYKKKKEWEEAYVVYSRELDAANAKRHDYLEKAQSLV